MTILGQGQREARNINTATDSPPAIHRVDNPETLVERGIPEEDWCCDWRYRVFPGWCDLGFCTEGFGPDYGLMIDQTADLYFTIFFRDQAPEGWSAIRDA